MSYHCEDDGACFETLPAVEGGLIAAMVPYDLSRVFRKAVGVVICSQHNGSSQFLIRALVVGVMVTWAGAVLGRDIHPAAVASSGTSYSPAEGTQSPGTATTELVTLEPTNTPRPTSTPTATAVPGRATLLFSDDFDGVSLDTDKWNTCHWWDNEGCTLESNGELEWYLPDEVLVSDGTLKLRARERDVRATNGITYTYTSGMVTTGRNTTDLVEPPKFAFQYGYVEMRAKVPKGQGLWSAFWLVPAANRPFPEIDIMEIIGREFDKNHMVLHYLADDGTRRSSSRSYEGPDWSADWHTFGLDWQPTALTWYIDGVPRYRYTNTAHIPAEPMVVVANLAVGGIWPGPPDATTVFPSYLEVDYVKAWSEMPPGAAVTDTPATQQPSTPETSEVEQPPRTATPTMPPTATATPRITPTSTAVPGQVSLLFSDDFGGTTLNADNWTTCYWWRDSSGGCTIVTNNELQWYQPDNVLVSDGRLTLRAQERVATTSDGKVYDYTSGMVSTGREIEGDLSPDRFTFQYGYAEIRAKIPKLKGLWPSFLMLAADQEWPPEIDVVSLAGDRTNVARFGLQYINPADGSNGAASREWRGPDFSRDWHTFGVDWQPDAIEWYVDGVKRWAFADTERIPKEPMYLVINLAVGGNWPGPPDRSVALQGDLDIDYVKVWSQNPHG